MPRLKSVRGSSWVAAVLPWVAVAALYSMFSSYRLLDVPADPVAPAVVKERDSLAMSSPPPITPAIDLEPILCMFHTFNIDDEDGTRTRVGELVRILAQPGR